MWPQLACWWIPCLPSSPPSISGLQGTWLPPRLLAPAGSSDCDAHPTLPGPAPSERPESVSAGGGAAAWEELGWPSEGSRSQSLLQGRRGVPPKSA